MKIVEILGNNEHLSIRHAHPQLTYSAQLIRSSRVHDYALRATRNLITICQRNAAARRSSTIVERNHMVHYTYVSRTYFYLRRKGQ